MQQIAAMSAPKQGAVAANAEALGSIARSLGFWPSSSTKPHLAPLNRQQTESVPATCSMCAAAAMHRRRSSERGAARSSHSMMLAHDFSGGPLLAGRRCEHQDGQGATAVSAACLNRIHDTAMAHVYKQTKTKE